MIFCIALLIGLLIGFAVKGQMDKRELASKPDEKPVQRLTKSDASSNESIPRHWTIALDPL